MDILQQSHLNDFSSIDREDEDTWNTTPLKTQHLDILNNRHSPEIRFLLYLSTYLKIYSANYQENDELEILNMMITAKIKQLFEISYQDDTKENMDWFVSDNHFDLVYPNNDRTAMAGQPSPNWRSGRGWPSRGAALGFIWRLGGPLAGGRIGRA